MDPGAADKVVETPPDTAVPEVAGDIETAAEAGTDRDGGPCLDFGVALPADLVPIEDLPAEAVTDPGLDAPPDAPAHLCCMSDTQCPQGWECVSIPGEIGVCKPTPEPGECWTDADCYQTQTCEGAAVGPCGMECDMPYEGAGHCTPSKKPPK